MTTIFDRRQDGPRTHALLIGVGSYPGCREAGGAYADLSSPPKSARAIAEWLMANMADDEIAPLGSIELLTSKDKCSRSPDFAAVRDSALRWHERCDRDDGNIALFFFSGHGCDNGRQLLLLEDSVVGPSTPFENVIDVSALVQGMNSCRAHTQCYFVDACRTISREGRTADDFRIGELLPISSAKVFREAPIVFSTRLAERAAGVSGGVTVFTEVLLQALAGGAASRRGQRPWEIHTDDLVARINQLLDWHGEHRQRASYAGEFSGRPIRRLAGRPVVPFRVSSSPSQALANADIELVDFAGEVRLSHRSTTRMWEDKVVADCYTMLARFEAGAYADARTQCLLVPPCVEHELTVTPNEEWQRCVVDADD